jgi:hypothetical protein
VNARPFNISVSPTPGAPDGDCSFRLSLLDKLEPVGTGVVGTIDTPLGAGQFSFIPNGTLPASDAADAANVLCERVQDANKQVC